MNKAISYPYSANLSYFTIFPLVLVSSIVVLSKFDLYIKAIAIMAISALLLKYFFYRIQISENGIVVKRLIYGNKQIDWKNISSLFISVPYNPMIPIQLKITHRAKKMIIECKNQDAIVCIVVRFLHNNVDVKSEDRPLAEKILNDAKKNL